MAFPTSPTDGQIYKDYVYNNTIGTWKKIDPGKYFDIGFIYTQYPGKSDPATLGWYGTWTNKSSEFAGNFFRAEGGNAAAFGSGQVDQNKSHTHTIDHNHGAATSSADSHSHSVRTGSGSGTNYAISSYSNVGSAADGVYIGLTDPDSHTHSVNLPNFAGTSGTNGSDETRPINKTIRVWERTA